MDQPDYTAMDTPTMLTQLGDNASKWAAAFCQTAKKLGYGELDGGWVLDWFANAIEQSHDIRRRRTGWCFVRCPSCRGTGGLQSAIISAELDRVSPTGV
jgi:hypothetical protein